MRKCSKFQFLDTRKSEASSKIARWHFVFTSLGATIRSGVQADAAWRITVWHNRIRRPPRSVAVRIINRAADVAADVAKAGEPE